MLLALAAAVTSSVPEGSGINGFTMFLRTIPYNYYAILTMVMSLFLIFSGLDYGPMKKHEDNALLGDLFTTDDRPYGDDADDGRRLNSVRLRLKCGEELKRANT